MKKVHAVARETAIFRLTATANQIIHNGYFVSPFAKMNRDMRTNEAATARHEYVQEIFLLSRRHFAEPY